VIGARAIGLLLSRFSLVVSSGDGFVLKHDLSFSYRILVWSLSACHTLFLGASSTILRPASTAVTPWHKGLRAPSTSFLSFSSSSPPDFELWYCLLFSVCKLLASSVPHYLAFQSKEFPWLVLFGYRFAAYLSRYSLSIPSIAM
jgi:hypothetical protein